MTESLARTSSQTFTIADARFLASRINADLRQVRLHYGDANGYLTEQKILDFTIEAAVLLMFGLLDNVIYGFQRDNSWVFALRYKVNALNQLELASDTPGGIYARADVTGASWHSYLTKQNSSDVSAEQKAEIIAGLPIQRSDGTGPSSLNGQWDDDKTYYKNGTGMQRGQFRS